MVTDVVILGCGPAGLLAAHAAVEAGLKVRILSTRTKSNIGGAQYLHQSVPGLTDNEPDGELAYIYRGDRRSYAQKLYGDMEAPVSWGKYRGVLPIWNLRSAYGDLWDMFEMSIEHRILQPIDLVGLFNNTTLVMSAIPLPSICMRPMDHLFTSQTVWINYRQVKPDPTKDEANNFILYNGYLDNPLYRSSMIFSWRSDEYVTLPESGDCVPVTKPLTSTCDCWPGLVKLGRYGRWDKEQLTHHAYLSARDAIKERAGAV